MPVRFPLRLRGMRGIGELPGSRWSHAAAISPAAASGGLRLGDEPGAGAAESGPGPGRDRLRRASWLSVLRVAGHLAVWLPFVASVARELQHGWIAVGDGAAIAIRSWDVLSSHGPLVGQMNGLGAYDPGPLEYWLNTVPVHLDPAHGLLWGAALCCMAAGSLAIEAARRAAGEVAGVLTAGFILAIVAGMPRVLLVPYWNPRFGAMFFVATLAAAWAVMCGHRRWWPVLVGTASVASQAHLIYAVASATLVLLAFIAGLAGSYRSRAGYRWAITGLAVGAACWIAPLIQQFTGRPGNLSVLIDGQRGGQRRAGLAFGLKSLAAAVTPAGGQHGFHPAGVATQPAGLGIAVLAVAAGSAVIAIRPLRCRPLAAVAVVNLVCCAAAVATFANLPQSREKSFRYLKIVLLQAGLLDWLVAAAVVLLVGRWLLGRPRPAARRARRRIAAPAGGPVKPAPAAGRLAGRARAAALQAGSGAAARTAARWAGAGLMLALSASAAVATSLAGAWGPIRVQAEVRAAAAAIERALPRQPVRLTVVKANGKLTLSQSVGIAWALRASGYRPELIPRFAFELGPMYEPGSQPTASATVTVGKTRISVHVHRPPRRPAPASPSASAPAQQNSARGLPGSAA
jgi:hypothetical protein